MNGRLPDASKGADHVREVFGRMGFNDQETVALCGAHTLGRCHVVRSGYDGPWTRNPLRFDNAFFRNLMYLEWKPKQWDGPFQYVDVLTEELMMLPTDMALRTDPQFRVWSELYAKDEQAFFKDFAAAYAKLLALGCPEQCDPNKVQRKEKASDRQQASSNFREHAMHGSVLMLQRYRPDADVHEVEPISLRSALHKAAFWGHNEAVKYLVLDCKINPDLQDNSGDTALHDACRFGHAGVVEILVKAGANASIRNKKGQTPAEVAKEYGYPTIMPKSKI